MLDALILQHANIYLSKFPDTNSISVRNLELDILVKLMDEGCLHDLGLLRCSGGTNSLAVRRMVVRVS
jgi:hypothetical protein